MEQKSYSYSHEEDIEMKEFNLVAGDSGDRNGALHEMNYDMDMEMH